MSLGAGIRLGSRYEILSRLGAGVIDEMYVAPEFRSQGVGRLLVDSVKEFGKQKGWTRIDVTAPESERWERTRKFYETEGFVFTGPKLKFLLQ